MKLTHKLITKWVDDNGQTKYLIQYHSVIYGWIEDNFPYKLHGIVGGNGILIDEEVYSMLVLWF